MPPLENFALFFSNFCSSMNVDKWSLSLPHGEKRSIVLYRVRLQRLQKTWTHAKGRVLPKTQSHYLLLFLHLRAWEPRHFTLTFRLGYELWQLGGCSIGSVEACSRQESFTWLKKTELSQGGKGLQGYGCSFRSFVNPEPLSFCDIPLDLTPPSGQFGWLSHPNSRVTQTCCWHQSA